MSEDPYSSFRNNSNVSFSKLGEEISSSVSSITNSVGSKISEIGTSVGEAISDGVDAVKEKAAGFVSGFPGALNDIASNIFSGIFGNSGESALSAEGNTLQKKVRLRSVASGLNVVFDTLPSFDDSRSVTYSEITPLHHPGQMLVYKNTNLREFTFSVKFVARNEAEARRNFTYLNIIRGWTMPRYGDPETAGLGAPPDILMLSGFGDILSNYGFGGSRDEIPVVLTNYSFKFDGESDYISTGTQDKSSQTLEQRYYSAFQNHLHEAYKVSDYQPVPIVLNATITVKEAYSPWEFSVFNISEFEQGFQDNVAEADATVPGMTPLSSEAFTQKFFGGSGSMAEKIMSDVNASATRDLGFMTVKPEFGTSCNINDYGPDVAASNSSSSGELSSGNMAGVPDGTYQMGGLFKV